MNRPVKFALLLGLGCFVLTPALPNLDPGFSGAAFAGGKGDKGDKADKGDRGGRSEKSDRGNTGKAKAGTQKSAKAAAKKAVVDPVVTTAAVEPLSPSELGKMNGAMHANINAVLAHIRNGQTTSGPVGLLAGIAAADALAGVADEALADLEAQAEAHTALEFGLNDSGFATLDDYLAAKEAGTVTPEVEAAIDGLIADAGGLTEDGTALAEDAPTAEELAAAEEAADAADDGVVAAEDAFVDAWNKDGDAEALLDMAHAKLDPYAEDIAAAVAEGTAGEADDATIEAETPPVTDITGDPLILPPEETQTQGG
jgi:hypothetical protein